ncbi:MAG: hypothetical protein ABIO55_09185 [Ginsengibacter sp.]
MENFYTAYTKTINGDFFYFVKHFQTFPEFKNVPPVLKNYGMHTDFYKACKIAMIGDENVRQQLLETVKGTINNAKIISMSRNKAEVYNFRNWQIKLPALLKIVNLR